VVKHILSKCKDLGSFPARGGGGGPVRYVWGGGPDSKGKDSRAMAQVVELLPNM
jgi:hypothetical protein